MRANNIDKNSREYLLRQMTSARTNLLLVIVFTVVNLVLLLTDGSTYFLFSASVPYYFTAIGMGMDMDAGGSVFTVTALVISALILVAYLLCWILSKKRIGWYIVAFVMFILDTVMLVVMAGSLGLLSDSIVDLIFHAWVLLGLGQALVANKKLKKLPPEEIAAEAQPVPAAPAPVEEPWNTPGE